MEPTRLYDFLLYYQEQYPDKEDALAAKEDKKWKTYSIKEYASIVEYLSYGLMALGLKKGDKIATVSNNRPEWNFFDMAMARLGIIHVPVYPTISEEEYIYILKHAEVKYLIIGTKALYKKVTPAANQVKAIKDIYTLDPIEGANYWKLLYELGVKHENDYKDKAQKQQEAISEEDVATIIYTSGTTGSPKGVMLTHKNMVQNVFPGAKEMPLDQHDNILSFLPLCHVYERLLNYIFQYLGVGIYYAQSLATIVDNLKEIKANGFNTVPRLLERVYDSIVTKGRALPFAKRKIFFWALNLAENFDFDKLGSPLYRHKHQMADKLIFKHWRAALGGHIKFIGSGGAALSAKLARVFHAAGINIQEGYGLTETAPLITFNHTNYPYKRFGTVGLPLSNVEVKIAEDGEILAKGPNIMKGYYKDPKMTKSVIDQEGFFHTGDVGVLEDGGFLRITDRKKEIFKSSSGKYIAPQVIENKLKQSFYISQALVVGENEKFVSALISPNFTDLHTWAAEKNINYQDNKELIRQPETIAFIQKEVNKINKTLGDVEQIKRFKLVCDEWSPEGGELSPTLKIRRKFLYEKYSHLLEEIYGHPYQSVLLDNTKKK